MPYIKSIDELTDLVRPVINEAVAEDRKKTILNTQVEMLEHLGKHLVLLDERAAAAGDEEFWVGFAAAVSAVRVWQHGHLAFLRPAKDV